MSKWTEYLKLIPEGLKDSTSLIEGIVNNVKLSYGALDDNKKEEIIRRRLICEGCPFQSNNATTSPEYKELTGTHYSSDRDDKHCTLCGCPIETRTASLNKACGIASWNKNHKDKKLPLKWESWKK